MSMLKKEDSKTMRKMILNFMLLAGLMGGLVMISLYFS